jgi:hypothetical protein
MPQNGQVSNEWQQELGPDWKEVHARYLHTIGNLTLTKYNSELRDHSFREKRDTEGGFADSPIRLNKSLAKLEHWNKHEIEKRAHTLADLAVQVWPLPQLSPEQANRIARQGQKAPLAEVIGPTKHPIAGFIPADFKIIQISEKRFHYLRKVEDQWIYYGNGKDPWYAISWENVGRWLRDLSRRKTLPLGPTATEVLLPYTALQTINGSKNHTLHDYPDIQRNMPEFEEHWEDSDA